MTSIMEIREIVKIASEILCKSGLESSEAVTVIEHLLDGELSEKPSHGFIRIPKIVKDLKENKINEISIERENNDSALINGGNKTGLIVADKATKIAIEKAKKCSISIVGGYNTTGTVGAIGHYTRMIAEKDLIGIMVCNSEHAIAPTGGYSLIFGTNPLSIGIPSLNEPFVLDFATSKMAFGDIMIAMRDKKKIPVGTILDKAGNDTTDPNDAWEGPLLPIAEHKGYGLAMAIELLAGPLVRAKAGAMAVEGSDGFTIIAINPEVFGSTELFKAHVSELIRETKNSKRLPGIDEIFFPGEKSNRNRQKNKSKDSIRVSDALLKDLKSLQ